MVAASSKGIGRAIAEMLAREGCALSLCARDVSGFDGALSPSESVAVWACDVSDAEALERWVVETRQRFGRIDILVTNTGGPPAGRLGEMTDAHWQSGIDATLLNVVRLVRLVGPSMSASGWGRIVHVTSLVAKEPSPMLPISSTLRAGLMALTRLQALELAPYGVTVNAVLPGHTATDRQTHLASIRAEQRGISVEEALWMQADEVPMKRLASPAEIAAPAYSYARKPLPMSRASVC